jgi:hypothetical protein
MIGKGMICPVDKIGTQLGMDTVLTSGLFAFQPNLKRLPAEGSQIPSVSKSISQN